MLLFGIPLNELSVEEGKAVAGFASHRLPVVARGSVPPIYRREGLSPGDPR